jgi:pilus assembly protein Flp/PilA
MSITAAIVAWWKARTVQGEQGAAMVEYGLLVSLIAMACLVAVSFLGGNLNALFNSIGNQLP